MPLIQTHLLDGKDLTVDDKDLSGFAPARTSDFIFFTKTKYRHSYRHLLDGKDLTVDDKDLSGFAPHAH